MASSAETKPLVTFGHELGRGESVQLKSGTNHPCVQLSCAFEAGQSRSASPFAFGEEGERTFVLEGAKPERMETMQRGAGNHLNAGLVGGVSGIKGNLTDLQTKSWFVEAITMIVFLFKYNNCYLESNHHRNEPRAFNVCWLMLHPTTWQLERVAPFYRWGDRVTEGRRLAQNQLAESWK